MHAIVVPLSRPWRDWWFNCNIRVHIFTAGTNGPPQADWCAKTANSSLKGSIH
jgi:hypothetical protein